MLKIRFGCVNQSQFMGENENRRLLVGTINETQWPQNGSLSYEGIPFPHRFRILLKVKTEKAEQCRLLWKIAILNGLIIQANLLWCQKFPFNEIPVRPSLSNVLIKFAKFHLLTNYRKLLSLGDIEVVLEKLAFICFWRSLRMRLLQPTFALVYFEFYDRKTCVRFATLRKLQQFHSNRF